MEIGVYSFADISPDPQTGHAIGVAERVRQVLAAAKLAEDVGLDVFGLGEHHRLDLAISAPAVVMAAIAGATHRIRLTSAVTILSTADPVHVFEDFATVDVVSGGRAEVIVGRGAFVESFPLFGFDLADYSALMAENLTHLKKLNEGPRITWEGRFRPRLSDAEISPRPVQSELPIWAGTGGNPESAANAGRLGLPMTLANIALPPAELAPQVADYKRIGAEAGHDPKRLRVGLAGHMHIEEDSQTARDNFYPRYAAYFFHHAPKQSYAHEVPREVFDNRAAADGPLFVGSPQEIVDKMLWERELFGHQRYLAQIDIGGLPYASVARTLELLGEKVLPVLRREGA
jgi:alkanesulfonate monooxygenase SsuD/methylene tetrahydromethanopterin reductase-like flavin-dependent oxidoreductase (luciferase family)